MPTSIHPTAIVHPGAKLGQDVAVGPYCVIEDRVEIGDRCRLDAFVQIKSLTTLGADNLVHSYACLGDAPQHLGFRGEDTYVRIGDRNVIREYVTVHRGTVQGHGYSCVGSGCMLMAYVHVAHDCRIGDKVIMANAASLAGHVDIGDGAVVSGMSGVHQFVRIGEYAFLGAMGGFGQDVPPYMLATGVRAKLHGPNSIGLRRSGFSTPTVQALKKAFKIIFRSGLCREEALAKVEHKFPDVPQVANLVAFIRDSKRGVTPAAKNGDEAEE